MNSRLYACAAASMVIEETKSEACHTALRWGILMGKGRVTWNQEIKKLWEQIGKLLQANCTDKGYGKKIARSMARLCVAPSVMMVDDNIVDNFLFNKPWFKTPIHACMRPDLENKRLGDANSRNIALEIWEKDDWSLMTFLADSLEDSGREDQQAVEHAREARHYPGCWVVKGAMMQ